MNLAQRIAVAVTLLAVAVFLFSGGARVYPSQDIQWMLEEATGKGWSTNWGATVADCAGILLVGGVAAWLLGIKRKRS